MKGPRERPGIRKDAPEEKPRLFEAPESADDKSLLSSFESKARDDGRSATNVTVADSLQVTGTRREKKDAPADDKKNDSPSAYPSADRLLGDLAAKYQHAPSDARSAEDQNHSLPNPLAPPADNRASSSTPSAAPPSMYGPAAMDTSGRMGGIFSPVGDRGGVSSWNTSPGAFAPSVAPSMGLDSAYRSSAFGAPALTPAPVSTPPPALSPIGGNPTPWQQIDRKRSGGGVW